MYKNFKDIFTVLFSLLLLSLHGQNPCTVSTKDFKNLPGFWQGTLAYIDYSSNQTYTMPANVEITKLGNSASYILFNTYPNEASANGSDTLAISNNGRMLNNEEVISKRKLKNGIIEIVTAIQSVDGNENRAALIRHTYSLGKSTFVKSKEVQFIGQTTWIKRNEYNYKRK